MKSLLIAIVSLWFSSFALAEPSAEAIMASIVDRYQGETKVSQLSLITCEYKVVNKKIKCKSQLRKKVLQSIVKNSGENLKDTKGFTHILSPVSDRGIGILQYDYEEGGKDTDQWLYLPELGKVKRIASDGDAPKKGSLFGSEFSMEDIERPTLADYHYELVDTKEIKGKSIAIIHQIPTPNRAKKSNYGKQVLWVDLERSLVLKTEYYGHDQVLLKVRQSGGIEKIDGIWTVGKEVMRNVESKRISELNYSNVVYNQRITDDMLTQRMLIDPVFRDSKLASVM